MAAFFITVGVVIGLAVLCFAAIGIWACLSAIEPYEDERARITREHRQAEWQIAAINRRAQEAIMTEAIRRLRSHSGEQW
jgi:hypothetical protein